MTLDTNTDHFHPSPPRKSYNPFESDDDKLDSPDSKSEDVYTQEDHVGFDPNPSEKGADAVDFHVSSGDLSWEEAIFGQPTVDASTNDHTSLFVQDGQLYTDKNVTECEVPELVVCYKENNYQSVKDIGVDEGMPILDKLWVQSSEEDESKDSSSLVSRKGNDAMMDGVLHPVQDPSADAIKNDVVNGHYLARKFEDEDSLKITEFKIDLEEQASFPIDWVPMTVETAPVGLVYDVADSHPVAETDTITNASKCELDLIVKDGPDHGDIEEKKGDDVSIDKVDDGRVQEPNTEETTSKVITECEEVKVESDETPNEEKSLPSSSKDATAQESSYNSNPNKTASNSKLVTIIQEDEPQNVEPEKPPMGLGETSFSSSAQLPLPSSITFLGPVAYSGNISLRSESSAGSTRSFAFPVMQTEWNSSPVRMAKPDPRLLRKQRGWMQSLMCCRF